MKHLLLDGFNLAFRAYHAVPALTRDDGFPTGALQGWTRMLWKLYDQETPCRGIVFFDKDGSKRHLALHADYKANRAETPEPLAKQIPGLKTLASLLGFCVIEQSGVEADDLIASAAHALTNAGHEVRIASADKDFAQCVNARTHLIVPPPAGHTKDGWAELDASGVREKFGVPPEQIVDYLSLIGDTIDNIPGLPGVGPKTAASWLAEYGNITALLANHERIRPERFRNVLRNAAAILDRNRQLITFRTDISADWEMPADADNAGAAAFFEQMQMRVIAKQFEQRLRPKTPATRQMELF
ncbi:MAG: hypothetical protein LBS59_00885 [Puniceicoccales bacterium]|jgi:DNA polymerase-1|nr:hypothetical protein [Puniceicoccales bacterium]